MSKGPSARTHTRANADGWTDGWSLAHSLSLSHCNLQPPSQAPSFSQWPCLTNVWQMFRRHTPNYCGSAGVSSHLIWEMETPTHPQIPSAPPPKKPARSKNYKSPRHEKPHPFCSAVITLVSFYTLTAQRKKERPPVAAVLRSSTM